MPKCKKRKCNAHSLRSDPYCLFHKRKEISTSKTPVRRQRTKDQDSIIRTGLDNLFNTEEGRELLRSEITKQLTQRALVIPIGISLQILSWNYPGYFHQHVYDKLARGLWSAWFSWYRRYAIPSKATLSLAGVTKAEFMATVDSYIASRYVKTGRITRAMIGGTARLASKAIFVLAIADALGSASRISQQAFGTNLLLYERDHAVKPGVREFGKASYLETLVRSGEYRV